MGSWLWHSLIGYHVVQFLLLLGRFIPPLNIWIGRFTSWLVNNRTVSVDNSLNIFNLDCKVRSMSIAPFLISCSVRQLSDMYTFSIDSIRQSGRSLTKIRRPVCANCAAGLRTSLQTPMGCAHIAPWKCASQKQMMFG